MAYYIKANHLVAEFLKLENVRLRLDDGNFILWQADLLPFGPLTRILDSCAAVGALALLPHEARQEQDGSVCRQLPVASDHRFVLDVESEPEHEPEPAVPDQDGTAGSSDIVNQSSDI